MYASINNEATCYTKCSVAYNFFYLTSEGCVCTNILNNSYPLVTHDSQCNNQCSLNCTLNCKYCGDYGGIYGSAYAISNCF